LRGRANNYRLRIPPNIPVKNFWSIVAYDADSRSILRNNQPFPSVSTYSGPQANSDGAIDVYFGPEAPAGRERNWVQTMPGKGWFVLFRFYGPLDRSSIRRGSLTTSNRCGDELIARAHSATNS